MKTLYWLSYPTDYKEQLKPLLHQQMWLFGQDILCPDGNLLYDYRFTHTPADGHASPMYIRSDEDRQIVLWGWGIWFSQADLGAVFVNRFMALPRFTVDASLPNPIHQQVDLPHLTHRVDSEEKVQAMCQLWTELLQWLAHYEAWVIEKWGIAWRQTALQPFPHAATQTSDLDRLADQWQSLADQSKALSICSFTP